MKETLGFYPTPIHRLSHLEKEFGGLPIYVKRDDLTGLAFGGNKVRKLEYLMADAKKKGADSVLTAGAAQSNHCRQTAAAAAKMGFECHLALGGTPPPSEPPTGNLLLDYLLGAKIHWCGDSRKGETIPEIETELKAKGKTPYIIPYGGSNAIGAMGFLAAYQELWNQIQTQNLSISHLFVASSSGATQAGLILGNEIVDRPLKILGVPVDPSDDLNTWKAKILSLVSQLSESQKRPMTISPLEVGCVEMKIQNPYGQPSTQEIEWIHHLARLEGIFLDPVYTARAFVGMVEFLKNTSSVEGALFWHTGGVPTIFSYSNQLQKHD